MNVRDIVFRFWSESLSATTRALVLTLFGALALNAAEPPMSFWPAAVMGCAALFVVWKSVSPLKAMLYGALSGFLYFALAFWWIGSVAGRFFGSFAPVLDFGPALIELPAFVASALVTSLLRSRGPIASAVGAAAGFALCEGLRTLGVLGVAAGRVGVALVDSPLGSVAMYAGAAGVTFAAFSLGALVVVAIRRSGDRSGGRVAAVSLIVLIVIADLGRPFAPAGPSDATVVAAIQGNFDQLGPYTSGVMMSAILSYMGMTSALPGKPALVVLPEGTVLANLTAKEGELASDAFRRLAREKQTTLVVGAISGTRARPYNTVFFYDPRGRLQASYRKRHLVPFFEAMPVEWMRNWPLARFVARYRAAVDPTVVAVGNLRVAPLICWEAGFENLAHAQLVRGVDLWAVSSDDAWFGATAGTIEEAQLAQMLALETGRYVIRAAATGISGIIAPDGRFTERIPIGVQASVLGQVGPPRATLFSRFGPAPVAWALALIVLVALASPRAGRRPRGRAMGTRLNRELKRRASTDGA